MKITRAAARHSHSFVENAIHRALWSDTYTEIARATRDGRPTISLPQIFAEVDMPPFTSDGLIRDIAAHAGKNK